MVWHTGKGPGLGVCAGEGGGGLVGVVGSGGMAGEVGSSGVAGWWENLLVNSGRLNVGGKKGVVWRFTQLVPVRWIELMSDYDCEMRYHHGKANVVVDALSWKKRIKPLRVRALMMIIHNDLPKRIREAQEGAIKKKYKSYVDKRLKPLEFKVGDMVLLNVSPWKGAVHFEKRGKLSLRYIRPFKILARVGHVAYTLELLEELKGIHSTFHVSNLKKCLTKDDVVFSMNEIQLDDKLHMIEEPVKVVDREVKRLKQSRIPIVKVRWIRKEAHNLLGNVRIRLRRSTLISLQVRTKQGKADKTS
nr:putative reverse transcriptase domain-containing protein [Tanacetum cinerariifolium]